MLIMSLIGSFFPGQQFSIVFNFLERNLLWKLAFGIMFLAIMINYMKSNTEIFMEMYNNDKYVNVIRKITLVVPFGFLVLLQMIGMFSLAWLLQTLQKTHALEYQ